MKKKPSHNTTASWEEETFHFHHQCLLRSKDPIDLLFSSSHSLFSLSPFSSSLFSYPLPIPIPIPLPSTLQFPLSNPKPPSSFHSSIFSLTRFLNPLRYVMTPLLLPVMLKTPLGSSMRHFLRQKWSGSFEIRTFRWDLQLEFMFMKCRGNSLMICSGRSGIPIERPLISPPMAAPSTALLNRYLVMNFMLTSLVASGIYIVLEWYSILHCCVIININWQKMPLLIWIRDTLIFTRSFVNRFTV